MQHALIKTGRPRRAPTWIGLGAAVACALLIGCVQRTVRITSEPSGSLVYLNDEEVGRTPLTTPFTFYGTYDVRLQQDGYQTLWTQQKAVAPWWESPGPDLFAEMIPDNKVQLRWHFQLSVVPDQQEQQLIERAQELRARVSDPPPAQPQQPADSPGEGG